jgi:hypothetical protein
VPIWKVTGWAKGLIPWLVLPKVKLDLRTKASVFGPVPKLIIAVGLKAANGTSGIMPISWGMTGLSGGTRQRDRGHHRVASRADHRDSAIVCRDCHIGLCPIRGNADPQGATLHRDRGHHRVAGRGDHRNSAPSIRDIGVLPSGVMAIPRGSFPTGIGVPTTVLVAVAITETVPR